MAMEHRDIEKEGFEHVGDAVKTASDGSSDRDFGFTPQEQRRIINRIDRRLVVIAGAMYCVSLMDRTNMSAAAIAGMTQELKLVDNKYVSSFPCRRTVTPER
jgi:3-oxoacyl-[acyl-carrier-protein] synthase III